MSKNPEDKEQTIELIEEDISIGVRPVETGKVRVDVKVNTEERLVEQVLERQEVTVTRIPVNRTIDAKPKIRQEGDTMIVPLVEEVLVIEKRLFLREELHIQTRVVQRTENIPVTLRSEEAIVTRDAAPAAPDTSTPPNSK
jgi:uncharacterized protein (TIGR02271 family)